MSLIKLTRDNNFHEHTIHTVKSVRKLSFRSIFSPCFFFPDKEWGLPLAIAANLHLPYRIKIGLNGFADLHNVDAFDRRK